MLSFIQYLQESHKEIEFVCHNCQHPDSTPRDKQKALHQDLKKIHGVIPLHQNWSDEHQTQHSLSAIYKTPEHRKAILSAAKKHGVKVDIERKVDHSYVDRAVRGEHDGQEQ